MVKCLPNEIGIFGKQCKNKDSNQSPMELPLDCEGLFVVLAAGRD